MTRANAIPGTIIRRGNRWSVVMPGGRDANGKRIRDWHSGYTSEREAEAARLEILSRMHLGMYIEPSKATVRQFLDEWLEAKKSTIRPNTLSTYTTYVRSHIAPRLGFRRLQQLQPGELNSMYADLLESGGRNRQGLSAKTIRNIHGILHKALADAARWGLVTRNVADLADPPIVSKPSMQTWTAEQGRQFLESIASDRLAGLWRLLASTGMRRSEVLGIRWTNADLERKHLVVADTVVMVDNRPMVRLGVTKSKASARTIALDARTVTMLREHRQRQLAERMAAGPAWQDNDLMFCREDGTVISPDWLTRRAKTLVGKVGLPWVGIHAGLRHGWATWALQSGVPPKVVQERLGHSSIATTLDQYTHVASGMDREAAETVAEVFN